MIFSSVDLPAPLAPSTPILAPGRNESQMSLRTTVSGGWALPSPFIVKTYCGGIVRDQGSGIGDRFSPGNRAERSGISSVSADQFSLRIGEVDILADPSALTTDPWTQL